MMVGAEADSRSNVRMSIVVPVYNKETTLHACMKSICNQTVDDDQMEVIFIDDGSTDGSLSICMRLSEQHANVKVFSQANQGVSAARNSGIERATGDYIMFLDADDSISRETIKSLIGFFDKVCEEVDIITYPLKYLNPRTGKKRAHKREEWLTEDGVYGLAEFPYIAQTTMNVCVKNKGADSITFERSLKMGEDQMFIMENLKRKAKIGFCSHAEYVYVKDGNNASRIGNNPLYAYDDMIFLFKGFARTAEEQPLMKSYAYQTLLYNIDWRLKGNMLFPTFCEGERREEEEQRLAEILQSIPAQEYCKSPYLSEYHKGYLLERYGFIKRPVKISYAAAQPEVVLADGSCWVTDTPTVLVTYCMREGGQLFFKGRLTCPTFLFEKKPELFVESKRGKEKLALGASSYDYNEARFKTAKCYSFEFSIADRDNSPKNILKFSIEIPERQNPSVQVVFDAKRHNARVVDNTLLFKKREIKAEGDVIVAQKRSAVDSFVAFVKECISDKAFVAKRAAVGFFMLRNRGKRVWLYSDLPTSPTEGNALIQFLHDISQNDGIDRYYVSNYGNQLVAEHPEMAGRILRSESREHVYHSLKAEVVLASYLENFTYRPVSQKTFDGLGDYTKPQKLIYLQHGILHAHMPWYYSYDRILFDYEVVSTQFEIDNLTKNYYFPKDALIPSGMPRFDRLQKKADRKSKRILFAPSWRGYLVAGNASERTAINDTFSSSSFHRGVQSFFKQIEENGVLEESGYSLEIKLHPNFKCYEHLFGLDRKHISLAPDRIQESDYSIIITDFSSYVYDFVYVGSRVLYFVPDHLEFTAGLNQYAELDMPFEAGFGPFCQDSWTAVESLRQLILQQEQECVHNQKYRERRTNFFLFEDGCCAKRLYERILLLH